MNNFLKEVQNDRWLEYAASFPIAFAQVREDPLIDQWVANQLPAGANGIMIASGGCTAALLAASGRFERLTLVDMNAAQLALSKLKIAFVSDYDMEERLNLLGHRALSGENHNFLQAEELQRHQIAAEIFGEFQEVATIGLDYVGRYELLFSRLHYVIADTATTETLLNLDSPQVQIAFLQEHPVYVERLRQAFAEVMALPNLVRLFGKEATQNSVMPFAEHFFQRTLHAIETLPASSNPYLAQLVLGRFTHTIHPWLQLPKQTIDTRIEYKQSAMVQALLEASDTFDFIHLSNILDWLSREQARLLLETAAAKLKKGGWLIIRQLNSNLPVRELCPTLEWKMDLADDFHANDRSFFYQKLHIACKA